MIMGVALLKDIGKRIVTPSTTTTATVWDGWQESEIALEESIEATMHHHPREATTIATPRVNINWVINTGAELRSPITHATDTSTTTHEDIEEVGKKGDKRV
jgi:hypothetical protein